MKTSEVELRALMKASLEGDAAAYRTLLVDVTPHLRAYFKNRLGASRQSATQVENLVQAALITIHHRRHTYASQRALIPWICAIARYRLLSHLRETRGSLAGVSVDDACDLPDGNGYVAESSVGRETRFRLREGDCGRGVYRRILKIAGAPRLNSDN